MKAKTFENLIRKIVREEIDYALRREIKTLKEDLRENTKPTITEQPISKPTTQNNLKEQIMGKKTPQEKLNFVGNNTLNDLLNETAQGDTNLDRGTSPVSMEGDISTIGGVPAEVAPKAVQEAVNRDYSGLMKAIDKKKNHRP
tara:strand:- start:1423 stop:1851 length:429 start_codon:yes stop_codon:yes gene_type:complete